MASILAMREHEHAGALENSHLEGYAESEKDRDADIKKLEARIEELETENDALELTIRDLEGEITERDACSASTAPGTIPRHRDYSQRRTVE
jgi:predicted RNase H-like nuclease (RuvC/YqgF family)